MARPKIIITKTELAAVLGLSKGRISQLCKREDFPVRPDGKVNRDQAMRWYKDSGMGGGLIKRGPKPKRAAPPALAKPEIPEACTTLLDYTHAERVKVLEEIAAPAEVLRFARVALRMGCTPAQAYALAEWYACQPCLALDGIEAEDLSNITEPTREQWTQALGGAIDFDAADVLHDRATAPETTPHNRG